jgi:hypothetical protein
MRGTEPFQPYPACRYAHASYLLASVARIERSEIRGLPFGTGLPYLDFAALNPGYSLMRAISLFGP